MEEIRKDRILNIPNFLTLVRIALLPVIAMRFKLGDMKGALLTYIVSMATDAADGFIARQFNQITSLGKLLDPLADKLSLVMILWLFVSDGQVPLWVLAIILVKEIVMIIGSGAALKRGIVVYALPIGKVTTVAFVISTVLRLLGMRAPADLLLWVSLTLSVVAFCWYSWVLTKKLRYIGTK